MSVVSSLRRSVNRRRYTRSAVDLVRPVYRDLRTRWLCLRHPRGGFVTGNGVRVFVDFQSPTYEWYDADAPNLRFDQRIIRGAIAQSGGNVFVDIGAHFGFFAAYAAGLAREAGTEMRILAFEPDRLHFECLRSTLAPYGDLDISIFPVAVSDTNGTIGMYRSSDASCLHSYPDDTTSLAYSVDSITLDSALETYLDTRDCMAVIKIDVDGAEPSVFRGAERVLREHRPIVFTELAPKLLRRNRTDPQQFFSELCSQFHAYWVRYELESIVEVRAGDFEEIEASIDIVTDVLLSDRPLDLERF
jgi:FkbM family methyltransferase